MTYYLYLLTFLSIIPACVLGDDSYASKSNLDKKFPDFPFHLPKPTLPPFPEVHLPELPPFPPIPELPKPEFPPFPELPKPTFPKLPPLPELPTIPGLTLPGLHEDSSSVIPHVAKDLPSTASPPNYSVQCKLISTTVAITGTWLGWMLLRVLTL